MYNIGLLRDKLDKIIYELYECVENKKGLNDTLVYGNYQFLMGKYFGIMGGISVKRYKEKHARRELKKAIKEISEYYGEPSYIGRYNVIWSTGKYIGDTFEIRMTGCPEKHEQRYYGYC